DYNSDGVGILEIEDTRRAVGERVLVSLPCGDTAVRIEPLDCAGYVRQLGSSLAVGIELGPVIEDQTLSRADRAGSSEHGQHERTGGRTRIADRKVCPWNQRSFACNRRNAVRLENLGAEYLGCRGARTPGIALGEPIKEGDIPRITRACILDIEAELPRL